MCHFLCNTRNIVGTLRTKQKWIILLKFIMVYDFKKNNCYINELKCHEKAFIGGLFTYHAYKAISLNPTVIRILIK
jgi:hypothetical protein